MQITRVEVTPIEIKLRQTVRTASLPPIDSIHAIFVRFITREGSDAWGCTVAHPELTGSEPSAVLEACQTCADLVPDLHPTNLEYSLAEIAAHTEQAPPALVAFDMAFHDLLGKAAGLPLYKLLGGYRLRIPTSVTIPIAPIDETVELALKRAQEGFKILKLKGGLQPEEDVQKVKAVHRALPKHKLRLDPDGGYDIRSSLDVARALRGKIEMLEQPSPADDLDGLSEITNNSSVPIIADQSVSGLDSALKVAADRITNGYTVKVVCCGGIRPASQLDTIARAANLKTMVSCIIEPQLLIAAGLGVALSSPNVQYCDLDGYLDLVNDPSKAGFRLDAGELIASEEPGLGCQVNFL
ncbi:MAG: hypothetical protein GTO18_10365 [Anaerolineales bacterium]|nr:hypothetical protein [Anaerolineales bacterium]